MSPNRAPRARGRAPKQEGAPHGRAAVEAALLAAGTDLFAARGPAAVSIREIAAAAQVNHGLVHRYFGSKDGLLSAVLDELAGQVAASLPDAVDVERLAGAWAPGSPLDRYWRVLARTILDGEDPRRFQRAHPTAERLVPLVMDQFGLDEHEARLHTAQMLALHLGWHMFEPFLVAAAGLGDEPADALHQSLLRAGAVLGQGRRRTSTSDQDPGTATR